MKNFEYAQPRDEHEAVQLLAEKKKNCVVLAGGTDLVGLMKRMVVTPDRVVNICEIPSFQQISKDAEGNIWIGAAARLDDVLNDELLNPFPAVAHAIQGISSVQLQSQGTLVGELLRRPECWYFREGHGLLADNGRMVVEGDNRFHAILGNRGPAKFVSASRLAPALIAIGAYVRVIGPEEKSERFLDVQELFQTPKSESEHENVLAPGQLVTHVLLPPQTLTPQAQGDLTRRVSEGPTGFESTDTNAAYEVRHGEGPDQPLAAAAVRLKLKSGRVQEAKIVLGQVAPTPWLATDAAISLIGREITEETAAAAGWEAVAGAMALSHNEYKIQLAQVAVKRALLRAVELETGGLDSPLTSESSSATQEINFA